MNQPCSSWREEMLLHSHAQPHCRPDVALPAARRHPSEDRPILGAYGSTRCRIVLWNPLLAAKTHVPPWAQSFICLLMDWSHPTYRASNYPFRQTSNSIRAHERLTAWAESIATARSSAFVRGRMALTFWFPKHRSTCKNEGVCTTQL